MNSVRISQVYVQEEWFGAKQINCIILEYFERV